MKLREYLIREEKSEGQFADEIGVAQASVNRYCNGRVPRPKILARICAVTKGAVTPNDWYEPAEAKEAA